MAAYIGAVVGGGALERAVAGALIGVPPPPTPALRKLLHSTRGSPPEEGLKDGRTFN